MSDQQAPTPYYLRCKESEKAKLTSLAIKLGVLVEIEIAQDEKRLVPALTTTTWIDFGYVSEPTGKIIKNEEAGIEYPETVVKCDPKSGEPYWHVNLYMVESLGDLARAALAKTKDPEIAAALKDMSRFFVTDPETGKPAAPNKPALQLM